MAIDVDELHEFYERAREVLGREWATTLMKGFPTSGADDLATKADLAATRVDLRAEMVAAEERMGLRLTAGLADLRAGVEEKLRVQTWSIVATMITASGVAFSIARFT